MAALGASGEQAPGVDFGTVEWVMSAIMARGLNKTAARRVPRPHLLLGSHTLRDGRITTTCECSCREPHASPTRPDEAASKSLEASRCSGRRERGVCGEFRSVQINSVRWVARAQITATSSAMIRSDQSG